MLLSTSRLAVTPSPRAVRKLRSTLTCDPSLDRDEAAVLRPLRPPMAVTMEALGEVMVAFDPTMSVVRRFGPKNKKAHRTPGT